MTAPTIEFVDPMRNVRPILWVLLVGGTLASLAGNVTHAVMHAPAGTFPLGPVIAAVLAPAALLGLVHLMGVWARDSRGGGAMQGFLLTAVAGIGAVAFRLSFSAVRDLAKSYGYGTADAALFPVMLDGVIVICTVSLVAASRLTDRARDAHAEAVHTADQEPPVHTEPVQPVYAPELVHQVAQPSVVHQPAIAPETVVQADAPAVTSDDVVVHQDTLTVHLPAEAEAVQAPEYPDPTAVQDDPEPVHTHQEIEADVVQESVDTAPVRVHQSSDEEVVHQPAEAAPVRVHQAVDSAVQAPAVLPVHMAQAEAVVQRGGIELPVERVAEVFARKDAGQSQNEIANAKVANKRTVSKVLSARAELDSELVVAGAATP